jgi:hypothetical protein
VVRLLGYWGEHARHRAQTDGNGGGCYSSISDISFTKPLKSRMATACSALSSLLSAISPGGGPSASISALIRSGMMLLRMETRQASLEFPRDVIGWICTSSKSPVPY